MKHFEHTLVNPVRDLPAGLEDQLSRSHGWFKNCSNTASVHPLFRKEMFSDVNFEDESDASFCGSPISDYCYQRLIPALRLATAMFDSTKEFWIMVWKAPTHDASVTHRNYFQPNTRIQDMRSPWSEVEQELFLMAQHTQICWVKTDPGDSSRISGFTEAFYLPKLQTKLRLRIAIRREVFCALFDPKFDNKPIVEQCIAYINFAVILLHELAHCLHLHKYRDYITRGFQVFGHRLSPPEPCLHSSLPSEIDFAFEILHLGGIFDSGQSIGWSHSGEKIYREHFDGSNGLTIKVHVPGHFDQYSRYRVSNETILMLLHESTWRPSCAFPLYLLPMSASS